VPTTNPLHSGRPGVMSAGHGRYAGVGWIGGRTVAVVWEASGSVRRRTARISTRLSYLEAESPGLSPRPHTGHRLSNDDDLADDAYQRIAPRRCPRRNEHRNGPAPQTDCPAGRAAHSAGHYARRHCWPGKSIHLVLHDPRGIRPTTL